MGRRKISKASREAISDLLCWAQQAVPGDEHVYHHGRTPEIDHDLIGLFRVVRDMSARRGVNGSGYWFVSQRMVETKPCGAVTYAYTIRAVSQVCWCKLERFSPDLGPAIA